MRLIDIHGSLILQVLAYIRILSDIRLSKHEELQSYWSAPQSKFALLWLQPLIRVHNVSDSSVGMEGDCVRFHDVRPPKYI